MTLFLLVLGLVAALLLGVWLGLGRFSQSSREIERALEEERRRKRVERRFTLLDLMGSGKRRSREGERARFRTVAPKRREGGDSDGGARGEGGAGSGGAGPEGPAPEDEGPEDGDRGGR